MKRNPDEERMPELEPLKDALREVVKALTVLEREADDTTIVHFKVQAPIAQTITHLENARTTLERAIRAVRARKGKA